MLAPWNKSYDLDSILKSRDITLPTKVQIVKAMVFPVVTYNCEIWTIKKAGRQSTDAFELWFWRWLQTPKSPLDSKEIKPVNLKGDQPWIFTGRTDAEAETPDISLEKSLKMGKIEGRRRGGHQRMWWLDGIIDAINMNLGKFWEMLRDREAGHAAAHGITKSQTQMGDWTVTNNLYNKPRRYAERYGCIHPCSILSNSLWPHGL